MSDKDMNLPESAEQEVKEELPASAKKKEEKKDDIQDSQENQRHIDAEKFKGIRRQSKHPQHQKIYAHGRRIKNSQLRQIS